MYEGRSHEMSSLDEKYYQYEGQHYEPYATIIGQSGLPLSIPYGLFQYAKHKDDPRNAKVKDSLRRGKWTDEEVKLTDRIIETFNAGSLELDPETAGGVTLRSYLSEKLGCDPMRITKKYTGASCLGKRVYHSANTKAPREVVEAVKIELASLEVKFREKLEKNSRDRLGLEADVDKHMRNQVVSTPSIDALLMHGSGFRNISISNMGYWPPPDVLQQGRTITHSSSSSSSSSSNSNTGKRSPISTLPPYLSERSNLEEANDFSTSRDPCEESHLREIWSPTGVTAIKKEIVEGSNGDINCDEKVANSIKGSCSAPLQRRKKKAPSRFPYSRYHDPSPQESTKGGFELSASSYYYAPSAQEIEESNVQQQKQQKNHMLLLQQQQQQQKQQYYFSLENSSDLPFIPKKTNQTHCVPTLANIGGIKRSADNVDSSMMLQKSSTKIKKVENSRNVIDLPFVAFLKSGITNQGGYPGSAQGHGQGLQITVPVVSDMSSAGNSIDDCSSGSGGGSPDAAGSEEIGSLSTGSSMNSDEGEGSDDNSKSDQKKDQTQSSFYRSKDYNKVSNYDFNFEKIPYKSGSKYDYKAVPSSIAVSENAGIEHDASYHLNLTPVLMSNDKVFAAQNTKCVSAEKEKEKSFKDSSLDEDEALSSMMSFFTYCHKVESEKEANF